MANARRPFRRPFRWVRQHPRLSLLAAACIAFVAGNVLAFLHAWSMTHYAPDGPATGRPESLSRLQKLRALLTGVSVPRPSAGSRTPEAIGLPYAVHRLKGKGGVELEAWHVPHPQPRGQVLLFHGYGACKAGLLPEAKALHELGYATLLVDFRGSGGSSEHITTVGMLEADDVTVATRHALEQCGDGPLVLYGRSMGSAAILRAIASGAVQPQAVILECPFDRLLSTVTNRFDVMGVPAFPAAHLLVFWGGVQHGFNGHRHNPVEYATQVTCPALVLHGAHDRWATRDEVERVFNALPGSKECLIFEECGHEAYLPREPQRWREAVDAFLRRVQKTSQANP